jgi:hypothetical protein
MDQYMFKKNIMVFLLDHVLYFITGFGLFLSANANATETADSNPAVRNTRLYDPGVGYDPPNSVIL